MPKSAWCLTARQERRATPAPRRGDARRKGGARHKGRTAQGAHGAGHATAPSTGWRTSVVQQRRQHLADYHQEIVKRPILARIDSARAVVGAQVPDRLLGLTA